MSVINFDVKQRLIHQATLYINNPHLVIENREKAIAVLLKALRLGDLDLRRQILLLLGSFAKEKVIWPLFQIMCDEDEPDELRDQAAIHIGVLGAFFSDSQTLNRRLISILENEEEDKDLRVRAILALGWEGNIHAVLPLLDCLYDPDEEIQEVAVNALCNLRDSRVVRFLGGRLRNASVDQKRTILFNLIRFTDRKEEVKALFLEELEQGNSALRLDVLILLNQLEGDKKDIEIYRKYLTDNDPRVRALVIERLGELNAISIEETVKFLDDPSMNVKSVALKVLESLKDKNKK